MATTDLTDKVIIVTGAGSGIGRAASLALARAHATVILCDIIPFAATGVLHEIHALTPPHSPKRAPKYPHSAHQLNVTSSSECDILLAQLAAQHPLHGLFNCAGINPTTMPLTSTTDGYFTQMLATNLAGPYHMTRAIIPHLPEHSGCSIVNVSSTAGLRASAGFAIYNMTKFGIIGFSKSMALELGPKGIRCNVVCPGSVETPTNASVLAGPEAVEKEVARVGLRRMGKPEEIADVVVFLFGEGARFVNGGVWEVDGGLA